MCNLLILIFTKLIKKKDVRIKVNLKKKSNTTNLLFFFLVFKAIFNKMNLNEFFTNIDPNRGHPSNNSKRIYLDNAARTKIDPEAQEALQKCLQKVSGNASSGYYEGRMAANALKWSRSVISTILGCEPNELIFTSCGTESNNIAIRSAVNFYRKENPNKNCVVVISSVEHSSISNTAKLLEENGLCEVVQVPVDGDGRILINKYIEILEKHSKEIAIISIIAGQNETGICQNIDVLRILAKQILGPDVPFHTDMTQVIGKLPVNLDALQVTMATGSAHKFHGPPGVGFLFVSNKTNILSPETTVMSGGGQEKGCRCGTENVPNIVATAFALNKVAGDEKDLEERTKRLYEQIQYIWKTLSSHIPEIKLNSDIENGLPHIISITFPPKFHGHEIARVLDLYKGISINSGSACSKGAKGSPTLLSMGRSEEDSHSTIRVSVSSMNDMSEIQYFCKSLVEVYQNMKKKDS